MVQGQGRSRLVKYILAATFVDEDANGEITGEGTIDPVAVFGADTLPAVAASMQAAIDERDLGAVASGQK